MGCSLLALQLHGLQKYSGVRQLEAMQMLFPFYVSPTHFSISLWIFLSAIITLLSYW